MKIMTPVSITSENIKDYGLFYDLSNDGSEENLVRSKGEGYSDAYTKSALIDRPGSLGMTYGAALPREIASMERHLHTQEAMLSHGEAVAFLVAGGGADAPDAEQVIAFVLLPHQAVVLNRGVWHSPAFGVHGVAAYYWMAEAYDGEPTVWRPIEGGPVQLSICETEA